MSKVFTDVALFMRGVGQSVSFKNPDQIKLYEKLIEEEYQEWLTARENKDEAEQLDACFDMIWVIVGYMLSKGVDCEAVWNEGSLSNLSKINPTTGKVIKREDGKILKPEGWKKPNFKKFVE
jgi:predicted HAD superfamily Cof-like phosphohydrolase